MALSYRLSDYILVDLRRDLHLEFSRWQWNLLQLNHVWSNFPRNEKQKIFVELLASNVITGIDLEVYVVGWTFNFQGQIYNLLYLSQIWPDCHETKSGHMDCIGSPICYHCVFELGHDLDLELSRTNMDLDLGLLRSDMDSAIYQPKMVQMVPRNPTQTPLASNVINGIDLGRDLEFSRSNMEFATSQPKIARLPGNKQQTYRFNCRCQMRPMRLTLAMSVNVYDEFVCTCMHVCIYEGTLFSKKIAKWIVTAFCHDHSLIHNFFKVNNLPTIQSGVD